MEPDSSPVTPATTQDLFLDGRLTIHQPADGYRAGMDALVLGAAAAGLEAATAADVGCGVGTAMLAAATLAPATCFTGIEREAGAAALARRNVGANALDARVRVVEADALLPAPELAGSFDLVFSNPPFFDDLRAIRPPAQARMAAWVAGVPLEDWLKAMLKLAAPKGQLLLLHRAERLGEILAWLPGRAGDVRVYPLRPAADLPAKRVLVLARKGSRAPLRLLKGLDLHPADSGGGRFSPEADGVFAGARLPGWPGS